MSQKKNWIWQRLFVIVLCLAAPHLYGQQRSWLSSAQRATLQQRHSSAFRITAISLTFPGVRHQPTFFWFL
jgi:hypothetical protein